MNPLLYQIKQSKKTLCCVVVVIGLLSMRPVLLTWVGSLLQAPDDRSGVPADVAFLLLGGFIERGDKAAEVVLSGRAHRVFWGRNQASLPEIRGYVANEADFAEDLLMRDGLSIDQLIKADSCNNSSTAEEAICLQNYFELHPPFPKKIAIVTSWYHTRRARWIVQRVLADKEVEITTISVTSPISNTTNWWRDEETAFSVINEYIKWVYYLTHYS